MHVHKEEVSGPRAMPPGPEVLRSHVQELRAAVRGVGEGVIEGVEGAGALDRELEGRVACEMEHLDGDAVVLG